MTKDKILLLKKRKTGRRRKHKGQFLPLKKEKEKQMRNTDFFYFKREYVKGNIFILTKKRKRKTKSKSIIKKDIHSIRAKKKRNKGNNRN